MAQIRIEEDKKKGSILPWILGVLLLALAIWGIAELFEESDELVGEDVEVYENRDDVEAVNSPVVANTSDVAAGYEEEVNDYLAFTRDMKGKMSLDHDFSHGALTSLGTAIMAIAEAHDVDLTDNIKRSKQLADEIQVDPLAGDHADKIRMAALNYVESLERIDKWAMNNANASAIRELRKEAQQIKPETLTLNQKGDVRTFFDQAGDVLRNMK